MKFGLSWFSADNDDLVGEVDLPTANPKDIRDWFFLPENESLTDCYIVRASQRKHLLKLVTNTIDLNNYDYFLECFQD